MSIYEFILELSFGQWVGIIIVCGIAMITVIGTVIGTAEQIPKMFKK